MSENGIIIQILLGVFSVSTLISDIKSKKIFRKTILMNEYIFIRCF